MNVVVGTFLSNLQNKSEKKKVVSAGCHVEQKTTMTALIYVTNGNGTTAAAQNNSTSLQSTYTHKPIRRRQVSNTICDVGRSKSCE